MFCRWIKNIMESIKKPSDIQPRNMLLVYMPWYLMERELQLGDYVISPFYLSGHKNLTFFQGMEDVTKAITVNHLERPYTSNDRQEFPIKHCSIVRKNGEAYGYQFSQGEQDEITILQYIVALSGISNREFLQQNLYLCSENFKVFFQKFTHPFAPPFTPAITTKRKDGSKGTAFSDGLFREIKPWHIASQALAPNKNYRLHFDEGLAKCLWTIYKTPANVQIWENHIYPSVFSFYLGNTDGLSHQVEVIYSVSAIEKLLLGTKFYLHELVTEFQNLITASGLIIIFPNATTRNWTSLSYKNRSNVVTSASNIFEAWLIESKHVRNNFAHGNAVNRSSLIWTVDEHLLISSFVYPLLLKIFIKSKNLCNGCGFSISTEDENKFKAIGKILEINDLFEQWDGVNDTHWDKIIKDSRWDM